MTNKCIVCGSQRCEPFFSRLIKCQECSFVWADFNLDDEQLMSLYRKSYFFGDGYTDYLADKKVTQRNFILRLKELQKFIEPGRHKFLFEIGSAYGLFLDVAREYFENVKGIDITKDGVVHARENLNLDVVCGDFLETDFGEVTFDIICMWDTIEHLRSPDLYIEKISRHTESGALLAITTGDINSINARTRKDKWRLIQPPFHIHYFSGNTLSRLLNKNGFDVVYCRHCGFYRSIQNAAHIMFHKKRPWLYNFLRSIRLTRIDFYSNLYDIMYVIARKR